MKIETGLKTPIAYLCILLEPLEPDTVLWSSPYPVLNVCLPSVSGLVFAVPRTKTPGVAAPAAAIILFGQAVSVRVPDASVHTRQLLLSILVAGFESGGNEPIIVR